MTDVNSKLGTRPFVRVRKPKNRISRIYFRLLRYVGCAEVLIFLSHPETESAVTSFTDKRIFVVRVI